MLMEPLLMEPTRRVPRYFTVADSARCLGLSEARVRDWQLKKFIAPSLTKGRIQFARPDVVRMHVLRELQETFGQTALATAFAQALPNEALERVLDPEPVSCVIHGRAVCVEAKVAGRTYHVELNGAALQGLRERMLEILQ